MPYRWTWESNITFLEWSQVDLQRQICWIHPDHAKAGKGIGIPLNETAVEVLRGQLGKPFAKAGISDFRFHDLRHTWGSWHVQARTPLNVLQELGGWSDYAMLLRYAHLAPEHLAQYAGNVDTFSVYNKREVKLKVA